jgi:ubiquinone/menaquinone biosynthesis C-methylase UbiE
MSESAVEADRLVKKYPRKRSDMKRRRLPKMEGAMARWYTRTRGSGDQREQYRVQAAQLVAGLPDGADVLEVAPGPGYHAVEMARDGRLHVVGLDLSHTFVGIATEYARRSEVNVDFRHGDAERMPFDANSFDLIVCQAAFKNFGRPVTALDEMHRVLRVGGTAVIQDMDHDASGAAIDDEVTRMRLGGLNAVVTKGILRMLRRRALSRTQFEHLATQSAFGSCTTSTKQITLEVRLTKR